MATAFQAAVEHWPLDKLIPHARNSRTHSDAQVAQIAGSISEFGFVNPVLVSEDGILIAGHGRVMAARKLGLPTAPVIVLRHLNDSQRRALMIADNKLALNAGWDEAMLAAEIGALREEDFDVSLLGFADAELDKLLAEETTGLTDPDDVPEAQDKAVAVPGDVWLLGRHRLACGDCTDPLVVDKALNGVKPHLMVTDPPYGVKYDPSWRNGLDAAKNRRTGIVENDDEADWREAWALFPGDVAYVWHGGLHSSVVAASLESCDFAMRAQIIWHKQKMVFGRGDYHWQHEPCWYAVKKGAAGHYSGDRKQTTVWSIDNLNLATKQAAENARTNHSTQKPVECMKRPIENNSSPGQAVYEPFSGSGTTIIAAEMTGRACHAIELNPAYVDVAIKRWQDFTGLAAVHAETGKTFAEHAAGQALAVAAE